MSDKPFWTVIMPVQGIGPYFRDALASVFEQTYDDTEILIQHNPPPRYSSFVPASSRILMELNPENLGCYGSINKVIEHSRGEWIHVLHDDDWMLPGFYGQLRGLIQQAPKSVGTISTGFRNYDQVTEDESLPLWMHRRRSGFLTEWVRKALCTGNPFQVCSVVFRRDMLDRRVGRFREDMPYAADWEFYARCAAAGDWYYHSADLARYRVHPAQRAHAMLRDGRAIRDTVECKRLACDYYDTIRGFESALR